MKKFDPHLDKDWKFFEHVLPILLALARKKHPKTQIPYENFDSKKEHMYCTKCLICDEIIYRETGEDYNDFDHILNHLEEHKTLLNML